MKGNLYPKTAMDRGEAVPSAIVMGLLFAGLLVSAATSEVRAGSNTEKLTAAASADGFGAASETSNSEFLDRRYLLALGSCSLYLQEYPDVTEDSSGRHSVHTYTFDITGVRPTPEGVEPAREVVEVASAAQLIAQVPELADCVTQPSPTTSATLQPAL